jgi:hypothetical protein
MLVVPILLDDIHKRMKSWGTEGKINPFREIYDVCFYYCSHQFANTLNHKTLVIACVPNDCPHGHLQ